MDILSGDVRVVEVPQTQPVLEVSQSTKSLRKLEEQLESVLN